MNIYKAVDRTPFTYIVTHLPSGKRYYGSRYAKGCQPVDLWKNYFTSSVVVKRLLKQDGPGAFTFSIRKTFASVADCRHWESKFLHKINARENEQWLNSHNGGSSFYNIAPASLITRQKMSKARLGKPKSQSMIQNSMWYYELTYDTGITEYIKGKVNVLKRLLRSDWETIRVKIQKANGYIARDKVTIRRMPKDFNPCL